MFETYVRKIDLAGCDDPAMRRLFGAFFLLQEKWVLFVVYRLLAGPAGFNELARTSLGVNTTTLAQRLDLLERAGVLTRSVHSTMPPRTSYELTEAGRGLRPVLEAIGRWAERYAADGPCPGDAPCAGDPSSDAGTEHVGGLRPSVDLRGALPCNQGREQAGGFAEAEDRTSSR